MKEKLCSQCKTVQPIENFAKKPKGWSYQCRECQRQYCRKYYRANRPKLIAKARKYTLTASAAIQKEIRLLKSTTPCTDCGKCFHFSAMDFDHLDPMTKLKNVSYFYHSGRYAQKEQLFAEIAKCELVCACCHRVRTWNRHQKSPESGSN